MKRKNWALIAAAAAVFLVGLLHAWNSIFGMLVIGYVLICFWLDIVLYLLMVFLYTVILLTPTEKRWLIRERENVDDIDKMRSIYLPDRWYWTGLAVCLLYFALTSGKANLLCTFAIATSGSYLVAAAAELVLGQFAGEKK